MKLFHKEDLVGGEGIPDHITVMDLNKIIEKIEKEVNDKEIVRK